VQLLPLVEGVSVCWGLQWCHLPYEERRAVEHLRESSPRVFFWVLVAEFAHFLEVGVGKDLVGGENAGCAEARRDGYSFWLI